MSPERFPRKIEPTVPKPINPPPCIDFITAIPMSVIMYISTHRGHLTLVKTVHDETILKAQKAYVKIGPLRYRSQYRIYSDKGKELILSSDKRHKWVITRPNEPHIECQIVEHFSSCTAVFSEPSKESIRFQLHAFRRTKFTNTATGKVVATANKKGFTRRKVVLTMDKVVDVSMMMAIMIASTEIIKARSNNGGGARGGGY